ncbi:sigma-54-dependent Fis family transcriptional regulator [Paraburkholderia sp. Ac-20336]|uniref:sigma-54-dependent transcriptional regulator n=1 Tax=Burkholderiaceae TaxID=119060 RepID=UPI00141FD55B|nr:MULTISPECIES: sigma-54 dependent transcriptional regulator [Burkholderiaceae]MBN3805151.1 sigma-54-dependent Fis family transcriptional regulator [Paraburkholderia sp. Ac-20336]NIF52946.1 sigma-54-dependent Fis family transcriptional regulator [Burkholderia sp. Ax-1724]NIF76340.1 sigma-54-dependent Fis family transcriptional regulator [Paraburkholderia sp. Cy-641]
MTTTCTPADTERTVLCVANSPDPKLVEFLAASGWQAVHAKSTAAAERMIERGNIKVGLVQLPEDCTSQQLSALASCMCGVQTNWVAQIVPGQSENELVSRFILDYCFDFVTQPWLNDRLVFALGHAHGLSSLRQPRIAPEPSLGRHGMVGQSEPMQQLYRRIDKCGVTDAPVFIAGESGTGKELTARAIHERSPRASRPFVAINCAAIPPSLLQAELFGHERGAFTGALQRKIGRIESAHEGTLFLDEIGDMPHECQAVLLRFLQEGTIERLGGNGPISIDVRVISATHVDLDRAVEDGRFRSDLYHRLCVLRLVEPPLRERGGDIKLLANYALSMYRQDGARKLRGLSSDAIVAMSNYPWPGNVRELINCVRRAVVMSEGRFITASDLGLPETHGGPAITLAEIRSKAEKDGIEQALLRHGYKLSDAAAELGISRATLYRLMHANRLHQEPGGTRGAQGGADADDEAERQASSVA